MEEWMRQKIKTERAGDRDLTIYSFYGTAKKDMRLPVVYVQDGGNVIGASLNYLEHLCTSGILPPLMAVGISPHDRNYDYTPWPSAAVTPDRPPFGGGAGAYASAVVHEIKPYVDRHYPTLPEPRHTGILGCSLGALVSLYAGLRHPDVFGFMGLLSASFWYEDVVERLPEFGGGDSGKQRIYMYVGRKEGYYKTNMQKTMVERTYQAHRLLGQQGFSPDRLKLETEPDGTHDMLFFSRRLPEALKWMFAANPVAAGRE